MTDQPEIPPDAISIEEVAALVSLPKDEFFNKLMDMHNEAFGYNKPPPDSILAQDFRGDGYWSKIARGRCTVWTKDSREVVNVTWEDSSLVIHWLLKDGLGSEAVADSFPLYLVWHKAENPAPAGRPQVITFEDDQYTVVGQDIGRKIDLRRETGHWCRVIGINAFSTQYLMQTIVEEPPPQPPVERWSDARKAGEIASLVRRSLEHPVVKLPEAQPQSSKRYVVTERYLRSEVSDW